MADALIVICDDGKEVRMNHNAPEVLVGRIEPAVETSQWPQSEKNARKKNWGLTVPYFWLVVIVLFIIFVAAIAGGVGGGLAHRYRISTYPTTASNGSCNSSGTTPASPSTYTPFAATNVSHIQVPCDDEANAPASFGGTYNTTAVFKPYCGRDNPGSDLLHLTIYSFMDCLDACVSYNSFAGNDTCVVAQFNSWMGQSVTNYGANCFLKSKANQGGAYNGTLVLRLCQDLNCNSVYK